MKQRSYLYRGYTIARDMDTGLFMIRERLNVGGFHYLYNAKQFVDQLYTNAFFERMKKDEKDTQP